MKQIILIDSIMNEIEGSTAPEALRHTIDCLITQYTKDIADLVTESFKTETSLIVENISQVIKQF